MAEVVNAGEVQRALSVDYSPLSSALQNYDQLSYRRSLLNEQRAQKKQADDYHRAAIVAKNFKDLDTGTNTPWDKTREALYKKAKDDVIEYQRANPNASFTELDYYASNAVNGIASGIDNAKLLDKGAREWAKNASTKYSHLDENQAYKYALRKWFTDDKGNALPSPSSAYNLDADLQDPAIRSNLLDPALTAIAARKELTDMKPVVTVTPDGRYQYEARPYMDHENKLRTQDISFHEPIPNAPSVIPAAALIGMAPADARVPQVNPTATTYQGVPNDVLNKVSGGPAFKDALIQETLRLAKMNPDLLKHAGAEQVAQIAARNLLVSHAPSDGWKPAQQTEFYKGELQRQKDERSAQNQAAHLAISRANLGLNYQKTAAAEQRRQEADTYKKTGYNKDGELHDIHKAVDYFNSKPKTEAEVNGMINRVMKEKRVPREKAEKAVRYMLNEEAIMKKDATDLMDNIKGTAYIGGVPYNEYHLSQQSLNGYHEPGNPKQKVDVRLIKTETKLGDLLLVTPLDQYGQPEKAKQKFYGSGVGTGGPYVQKNAYDQLQLFAPQNKKLNYGLDEMERASEDATYIPPSPDE